MLDFDIESVSVTLRLFLQFSESERLASTENGSVYVQVICEDQTINEHAEVRVRSIFSLSLR